MRSGAGFSLVGIAAAGFGILCGTACGLASASVIDADLLPLRRGEVVAQVLSANVLAVLALYLAAWAGFFLMHRLLRDRDSGVLSPRLHAGLLGFVTVASLGIPWAYEALKLVAEGQLGAAVKPVGIVLLAVGAYVGMRRRATRAQDLDAWLRYLAIAVCVVVAAAAGMAFAQHGEHWWGANAPALRWLALFAGATLVSGLVYWKGSPSALAVAAWLLCGGLGTAGLWFGPASVALGEPRPAWDPKRPRTVILLTIDTLRLDAMGTYNPTEDLTPTLTELSRQSHVFTQARSPSPWTRPSFASIHTGSHPAVHGVVDTDRVLPSEMQTLAERMHEMGYVTVGIGANHNLLRHFGFARGFDEYAMGSEPRGSSLGAGVLKLAMRSEFLTRGITDRALSALERHADGPLFLWLHYLTPHMPYDPPARYLPDEPPAERIGLVFGDAPLEEQATVNETHPFTSSERDWIRELYKAEVRYSDDAVAEFLNALKQHGRFDDAVIAFASDHGEEFWDHGGFEHGHAMYDELLHVPLFVRVGKHGGKGRHPQRVSTHALYPTLLELVGAPLDANRMDVESLVPIVNGGDGEAPRPMLATSTLYGEPQEALYSGDLKLIVHLDTQRRELYDLSKDPGELRDLAAEDPTHVQRLETLRILAHEDAAALRARLNMAGDNRIALDKDTTEQLRELGYVR